MRKRRRKRVRLPTTNLRVVEPGRAPGTLQVDGETAELALSAFMYGPAMLSEVAPWTPRTSGDLEQGTQVVWVDGTDVKDPRGLEQLGEHFGLHPLALEDVINQHQRPKLDDYDSVLFLVFQMPRDTDPPQFEQVSLFLGNGFVVTLQEVAGDCFELVRKRIRAASGRIRRAGADYLAYALLDAVVDHYYPIVERYSDRLDTVEKEILEDGRTDRASDIFSLRHDLQVLRRILLSTQGVVAGLCNGDYPMIQPSTRLFIRDCLDHLSQLLDATNACIEVNSALMELHLSTLNTRMNEVMKVLTMIATIFIPLSFIAGIYGMNFDPQVSPWNMPELHWRWGYPFALGLMLVTALGILYLFRRKGWIAPRRERNR